MDAFETLGLQRSLRYTDEELRCAFREIGKTAHPDAGGSESHFSKVQAAYTELSNPSRRLKHWLELQNIAGDNRGPISQEWMELFSEVGSILQTTDDLLKRRAATQSALAKALLENTTQQTREQLEALQEKLETLIQSRCNQFPLIESREIDGWQISRDLAFLEKWRAQARERYSKLW